MDAREAATLLGAKPAEIAAVDESDGGPVITTTTGTRYAVLAEDAPDAEGKTGLMLLAAPSDGPVATVDGRTTWNGFPLHVPWPDPDHDPAPAVEGPTGADPAPVETDDIKPRPKGRKAVK